MVADRSWLWGRLADHFGVGLHMIVTCQVLQCSPGAGAINPRLRQARCMRRLYGLALPFVRSWRAAGVVGAHGLRPLLICEVGTGLWCSGGLCNFVAD